MVRLARATCLGVLAVIVFLGTAGGTAIAWEPTKPVEFIAPAGVGGGADVMSRWIAAFLAKEKMAPQPFVVVNKAGGAGAEGRTTRPETRIS